MSGAMRRIGEYLGLLEDTGRYDEYDESYDPDYRGDHGVDHGVDQRAPEPTRQQETAPVQSARALRREERHGAHPAPVADLSERRRAPAPVAGVPSVPQDVVAE